MANSNIRPNRLKRLFDRIISGKEPVDNVQKCTSYLEAIPLQPDPSLTIERLASNEHALQALKTSLRADLSVEKINSHAVPLLLYLQDPGIAVLDGGSILSTILKTIVSAESFFLALLNHFNFGTLTHDGQRALGCVMHQLLVTDDNPSQHVELAETIEPKLSASHHPAIRQVGAKLKSSLTLLRMPQPQPGAGDDPDGYRAGGRHDNDFADYRSIAILPTADELACAEPPFLRTSAAVDDPANIETRQSIYLDHLFRMLREDLIYQAREELQIARGSKRRGNRRSYVFKNLTLSSCSTVQGHDRFSRFGLVLQGYKPLPQIPANLQTNGKRLEYLKNNPRFLKHGSTFCLMGKDAHLLGFVSLVRDENMLCMDKPRFHLVVEDDTAITSLLSICDSGTQLALIQVDVPVFAYAPFLQGLKKIRHLPLAEDLLFWTPNKETTSLRSQGFHALDRLVSDLRSCPAMDLKDKLGSNRSVVLDAAQHEALLSGLTQGLSVIQGPPGKVSFTGIRNPI